MNYQANTSHWRKGDIVLHDYDAKEPRMLMKVIGFTRDGRVKTQYCDVTHRRTVWKNNMICLHDPKQWHINPELGHHKQDYLEKYQDNWLRVKRWNMRYPPGTPVIITSADGIGASSTTGQAFFTTSGDAWVHLKQGGNWSLKFLQAMPNMTGELV
jgi:hypothetical protein